jgi:3-hydroxybutyryl-CoA dehydrogenase
VAGEIRTVGVVGLGIMGAGIVEVFARTGLDVVALEIDEAALERGREALRRSTERAVSRGRLTEAEAAALLGRIAFDTDYAALGTADLVVEAAPERIGIKRQVFAELDSVCRADTILATNTSSLSVTEIATGTKRPERVLGLHFFNPAPVMKLVEVIHTAATGPAVVATVQELAERLGKVPVTVADRAGFVANYLLLGYLNHAATLFGDGAAGREELDAAMTGGAGLPMGPLALMDLIGLDTVREILDVIHDSDVGGDRHAVAPAVRDLVTAGRLGRKTGRGFYTYDRPGGGKVVPDEHTPAAPVAERPELVDALLVPYLEDALAMLASGYADADGIDHAMTLGCGYPVGPVAEARCRGLA